jgi:hypothetical protein
MLENIICLCCGKLVLENGIDEDLHLNTSLHISYVNSPFLLNREGIHSVHFDK